MFTSYSIARRYRQSAALPSPPNAGPKARLFLQKAAQCFKAANRKEAIAVLRQFHNRSEKGNESNGEKEMENRKGRRNVGFSRGSLTLLYTLEKGKTKKPYKLYTKPYTDSTFC